MNTNVLALHKFRQRTGAFPVPLRQKTVSARNIMLMLMVFRNNFPQVSTLFFEIHLSSVVQSTIHEGRPCFYMMIITRP